MIFHKNHLLADNFHEISYLIFFQKLVKVLQNVSSTAVVTGALRLKHVGVLGAQRNHLIKFEYIIIRFLTTNNI